MLSLLKRGVDALVHPQVRLPADPNYPLTGKALGKAYFVGFFLFMLGSTLPMVLFFAVVYAIVKFADPEIATNLLGWLFKQNGEPQPYLLGGLMVVSFLGGFALQMRYVQRLLVKKGYTLRGVVGLSVGPMRGKTPLHTFWNIGWRAVLLFGFALGVEQVISLFVHAPEQPTIQYARQLTDGSGWLFFLLAGIAAPILEEVMFRGVLFQAVRATFVNYATNNGTGRIGRWLGRTVFTTASRADFGAVVVSSAVFALWHLQFHPLHLLLLFGMGCLLAETFRRTGTLWTSIAVHALNNGLMALLIMYGPH